MHIGIVKAMQTNPIRKKTILNTAKSILRILRNLFRSKKKNAMQMNKAFTQRFCFQFIDQQQR